MVPTCAVGWCQPSVTGVLDCHPWEQVCVLGTCSWWDLLLALGAGDTVVTKPSLRKRKLGLNIVPNESRLPSGLQTKSGPCLFLDIKFYCRTTHSFHCCLWLVVPGNSGAEWV